MVVEFVKTRYYFISMFGELIKKWIMWYDRNAMTMILTLDRYFIFFKLANTFNTKLSKISK